MCQELLKTRFLVLGGMILAASSAQLLADHGHGICRGRLFCTEAVGLCATPGCHAFQRCLTIGGGDISGLPR
jgi:hypothetical protein